MTPAERI